MKIALIHLKYVKKGGMESYLFDLIEGFHDAEIDIFTLKIDNKTPKNNNCNLIQNSFFLLPKLLKRFLFNRHVGSKFTPSNYDLSISLSRTSPQHITVCGGTHKGFLKHFKHRLSLKDRLEIYHEKRSYTEAKQIIAHSHMLADEIIELYGIDSKKVHLIYPPINTQVFRSELKKDSVELKKKWNLDPKKTTILFPSTGHERKGWSELSKAMRLLQEDDSIELVVAGNSVKAGSPNIRSLGFVHNMAELYAAVDYTILPAHYEPFGLVVAESLQCQTPVILSKFVGALELCTDAEAIVIDAITPQQIVAAIRKAHKERKLVEPLFAERNGLTIPEHIKQINQLANYG